MNLKTISKKLNLDLQGDPSFEIDSLCSIDSPKKNSIVCVSKAKMLDENLLKNAGALLIDENLFKTFAFPKSSNILISGNFKKSFAEIACFFKTTPSEPISIKYRDIKNIPTNTDSLYIGKNINIGKNCHFGKNVVIHDNTHIGDNCYVGSNVVIHSNSIIGNNVSIQDGCIIGSEGFGNTLSNNFEWIHICHLGNVVISDYVSIGSNCCIDCATLDSTVIESGVIIDNLVHIAHNVHIGENTAIAAKTGIAGSCKIGKRNLIGGMVGIVDHIKTADDVIITATSTVYKDIDKPGTYTGIMPISEHVSWKRIAFWITKLDKIIKKLNIKKP